MLGREAARARSNEISGAPPADEKPGGRTAAVYREAVQRRAAKGSGTPAPLADAPPSTVLTCPVLTLPDRPSIAVLPFQNMSGDAEQQYFSDGITQDIITELSVIAHGSDLERMRAAWRCKPGSSFRKTGSYFR
jgi:hypothetical protein